MQTARHPSFPALALLVTLVLGGCHDAGTEPSADVPYTISGTLDNHSGAPVPEESRVLVAWLVSSGSPDYAYIYGEGTVQKNGETFTLTFDAPPPAKALNSNGLGVGIVVATTDKTLRVGDDLPEDAGVIGAAGQHAVIYVDGDPKEIGGWGPDFGRGYNAGRGIDLPGTFDGFEPVDPSSFEIILDDLANIDFVNWT